MIILTHGEFILDLEEKRVLMSVKGQDKSYEGPAGLAGLAL